MWRENTLIMNLLPSLLALAHPHYGDPYAGPCAPHELNLSVSGVPGLFCSPPCDVVDPDGCPAVGNNRKITAMPECIIGVNSSSNNYCALICNTDAGQDQCGGKAACHRVSGDQGVCTYGPEEAAAPSLAVSPARAGGLFNPDGPALSAQIVSAVNSNSKATWKAELSARFRGWSLGRAANIADGAFREESIDNEKLSFRPDSTDSSSSIDASFPADFDARLKWPRCITTLAHVRDQTDCGGCWAFSATESFNDRRCIATNDTTLMSVQDTGACCSGDACDHSNGCVGGFIGGAWAWFTRVGVVSGGDQNDVNKSDTCEPFSLPICTHNASHVSPSRPLCPKGEYKMPACVSSCPNTGYPIPYAQDKRRANSSFKIKSYPLTTIYDELMNHGPVSTVITVFQDFIHYKSGVYKHLQGWEIGSHAIEVVGWGVEDGEKYWLCKNSWGGSWGIGGFMKIGYGEVGIENSFTAGYVASPE